MNESTQAILEDRFFHEGESTWDDVVNRVADYWVWDHPNAGIKEMLRNKDALPNTPALANAGRSLATGSACFVLPIEDSLDSIMGTLKDAAMVHKSGGGTGFDFSDIRPAGSLVSTTGRPAPGPSEMLKLYSSAIAHVTQAGMRPGANMGIIDIEHPDARRFVGTKLKEGDIHNFNISLSIPDSFMRSLYLGDQITAGIFNEFAEMAWENGEPGVFFRDTTNKRRLHPEEIKATNPCGEVPLRPYEACVLGSINLANHWDKKNGEMDWQHLEQTVQRLTLLLDNIIEYQHYPLDAIEREQKRYRKIGIGVMGWADLLCMAGIQYGSVTAGRMANNIMYFIQQKSYEASEDLASHYEEPYAGWIDGLPIRRNLNCQVIAPTGTIARLAGCSFGIEPHFDVDASGHMDSFVLGGKGDGKPWKDWQPFHKHETFRPASQVTFEEHIDTQAAFQYHTDQAVSKTINCPESTTVEQVAGGYLRAWRQGLKGITVLRENSRENVVIKSAEDQVPSEPPIAEDALCASGVCEM